MHGYSRIISSLAKIIVSDIALQWFHSFLLCRTQQISFGYSYSSTVDQLWLQLFINSRLLVVFGLMQGSVVGSMLTVFIDTLLRLIPFRSAAFANDIRLVDGVVISSAEEVQASIGFVKIVN